MSLSDVILGLMFFGGVIVLSGIVYMIHKRTLRRYIAESETRLLETINQPPSSSLSYMQQMEAWMKDDHNHRGG